MGRILLFSQRELSNDINCQCHMLAVGHVIFLLGGIFVNSNMAVEENFQKLNLLRREPIIRQIKSDKNEIHLHPDTTIVWLTHKKLYTLTKHL